MLYTAPVRRISIACAILAGLILCGAGAGIVLYPQLGAWALRREVLPRIDARLGREVSVGDIALSRGRVVLRDVVVTGAGDAADAPLARLEQVTADFDFWASLRGDLRLGHVAVDGARLSVVRGEDGQDNVGDLVARLSGGGDGAGGGGAGAGGLRMRPRSLAVTGASMRLRDAAAGVDMTVANVDAGLDGEGAVHVNLGDVLVTTALGPRAEVAALSLETDMIDPVGHAVVEMSGGMLAAGAGAGLSLSHIAGIIEPRDRTALLIDLTGSYGGATDTLWQARGWVDLASRSGSLDLEAEQLTFDRLDRVLRDSMVVEYGDTSLDAKMHIDVDGAAGNVAYDGTFRISGVNVFHPMLAEKTVRDLGISGHVTGSFDQASRTLAVTRADLRSRGIGFSIDGKVRLPGGVDEDTGERRARARVNARLAIPPVSCQDALDAIPEALRPYMIGFTMRGTFQADVRLAIDWADLAATELSGLVDIFGCRAQERPGEDAVVARLQQSFVHYVEVEVDQWMELVIGPENPDFVPLWDISPHLRNAIMTTEDSQFYDHQGFIPREFRTALIRNLEAGYFRFGASSITMQTVKNVLLYREKTLARKLQELFLTWYIETQLEKDRIFEIYLNAIEYGPGIYGIGPAARHYFGKHPRDMNPVEAAFIASILPSPKQRYKQYCDDRLWRTTEAKLQRIVGLMHKRGRLTDEEHAVARETPLVFDRAEAGPVHECRRLVRRAIENARPTNPMKK